ncbi:MAG TPA: hypothetical protein VLF62_05625 [Candidatus Saccharimonadales bacterium]|nr:hypothetical protein [Candidatus Saccharimonadales bacterium]
MADDAQADGYYAEDDMGNDELDLSFLDDDKGDKDSKDAGTSTPQK